MKKALSIILTGLIGCSILSACSNANEMASNEILSKKYTRTNDSSITYNYVDGATEPPLTYNSYISEITDFEFKLFRNLSKDNSENISLTAPINTALQLGLIANGASDNTREEIVHALGDDLNLEIINQCSSYFKSRIQAVANTKTDETDSLSGKKLENNSDNSYVVLKNALLYNDNSDVKTKFLQNNADYFSSDIYRFDFSNEAAKDKLNSVFKDIADTSEIDLDNEANLLSVTASDIYDSWLEPYVKSDIEDGDFKTGSEDTKRTVKYMRSNESYMKSDKAEGIVKYMAKTPLKLVMIMPNEGISLADYIDDFTYQTYTNLLQSIDYTTKAETKIPEFTVNMPCTKISDSVAKSGLYTAFTKDSDYFAMTSSEGFMFNDMYELPAQITINAAGIIGGTKTNDASKLIDTRIKELDSYDTKICFNRPFMFMIVDNESDIPIYIGTVQ